jgi:hypothetical protein
VLQVKPAGGSAVADATEMRSRAVTGPHPDIAWVNEILWGVPVETVVGGAERVRDAATLGSFIALPSATHPHLLVPDESRVIVRRALESYTDARRRIRAAAGLLAAGAGAGLPQLVGDRVRVSVARHGASDDQIRPPLTKYVADVLGRTDLELAVRMGGRRPNRKPVLQVLSRSGDVLAYVKVGWNTLTRSLVRNEADVLLELARNSNEATSFSVPAVIHAGKCGDLEVLIIAPVSPMPWFRRPASRSQLLTTSMEIASLKPRSRQRLATSAWWQNTDARLDALSDFVRASRLEVLHDLAASIEQEYGDADVEFGGWHGDWTCWNIGQVDARLVVMDWERSGPVVPVGLDAAHYDFDASVKFRKRPPLEAVQHLLAGGGSLLPAVAPDARLARLLLSLDLLEMVLRFEEARSEGLDILDTVYFGALRSAVLSG